MSESAVVVVAKGPEAENWLSANFGRVELIFKQVHQADPPAEPHKAHPHGLYLYADGKEISPDFSDIYLVVPIPSGSTVHAQRSGRDIIRALEEAGADLRAFLVDAPGHEVSFETLKEGRRGTRDDSR